LLAGIIVLNYRIIPGSVPLHAVYVDPGHRFHVVQPALWQTSTFGNGVALTDSAGVSRVLISVSDASSTDDAMMWADGIQKSLGLQKAADLDVGGITWVRREGPVTTADGAQKEMLVLVTEHNGSMYVIECMSPVASFQAEMRLVFQPLIQSFAFG
jgi:hypothetical protein